MPARVRKLSNYSLHIDVLETTHCAQCQAERAALANAWQGRAHTDLVICMPHYSCVLPADVMAKRPKMWNSLRAAAADDEAYHELLATLEAVEAESEEGPPLASAL